MRLSSFTLRYNGFPLWVIPGSSTASHFIWSQIFKTIQNSPNRRRTWHLEVLWNPEMNQTALETWKTFYSGLLDSFDPHLYHWNVSCQWWLMCKPGSKGPWLIFESILWRLNTTESFKWTGRSLPAYLTKKLDQDRRFAWLMIFINNNN